MIEGFALGLLRGDVGRSAADHAGAGEDGIALLLGEAEVHDIRVGLAGLAAGDQDVARLQVAVDEAAAVGGVDGAGHVADEPHPGLQRQLLTYLAEALAVDILHGDVGPALDLAHLVHLADVGVADPSLRPRLAQEALGLSFVVAMQELQGHIAAQGGIESLVDRAHASRSQEPLDAVAGPVREKTEFGSDPLDPGEAARALPERSGAGSRLNRHGTAPPAEVRSGAFQLGGELVHDGGGEKAGVQESPEPAPLQGSRSGRPALGHPAGHGVEILPAQETFGNRESEETALRS